MLNLKIEAVDVKAFMGALLMSDKFDFLEVRGVDVTTFSHFNISGQKIIRPKTDQDDKKEESRKEEDAKISDAEVKAKAEHCKWSEIKPFVHNIIKGGEKPGHIKIVFSMEPEEVLKLHQNGAAMYLNVLYNGEEVFFTSATAQKGFSLDKSLDHVWEDYLVGFFKANGINAREIEPE